MWVSELTEDKLNNELIDRILFEGLEDKGESADSIIVLGSRSACEYRVPVAVNAYLQGRADNIIMCGGKIINTSEDISEAELMYKRAIESGVPENKIIVEKKSLNTVENILCALVELQRLMWLNNVKRVLLVTTSFHMRRSLEIAKYLFPEHIEVYPCPADDTTTRRDNWMNSVAGIERVKAEVMNIVKFVRNGVFPDFEI